MNNPRNLRESHTLSIHPKVWKMLVDLAQSDYEGNVSAAATALILYNRGVTNAKKLKGEAHAHHVTRGIPQDIDLLESTIMEIEGLDPGFNARTWREL